MAKKRKLKKLNIDVSKAGMIFKYNLAKFLIPLTFVLIVGVAFLVFWEEFKVENVTVEGSSHYSSEEITNYVLDSFLCENSVYVNLRYKNKSIKDVPFVEQIDVKLVDKNTVKIIVYEKYMAGCIQNLGNYLYFDNDGEIVEVSKNKTVGVPVITGLQFDHFEINEELTIENKDVFNSILTLTKVLNKYGLEADIIFFDENYNITLFFEDVRVSLGAGDNLDEKVMALPSILLNLKGEKGVLHMEKYDEQNGNVVFNKDVI